jgi:hypothetical protein
LQTRLKKDKDAIVGLDFLDGNGDRHHNNIGYIRNPDTLEMYGLAPCFDNGACMSYDYYNNQAVEKAGSKLYYRDEIEELSIIDDFSWFKNTNVTCDELCDLYRNIANGILDNNVIEEVLCNFKNRYVFLQEYIKEKSINKNYYE